MGLYVSFEDVVVAGYGLDIPEDARESIERLIEKAEARLVQRVPTIPARILGGTLDESLVRGVLEDVVLRHIRNPSGYSSEQAGEFSYRIDGVNATGTVTITADDVRDLLPGGARRKVSSIRLGIPSWRVP